MSAPARHAFAYTILRVVPDESRGERVNVGVVLLCRTMAFLRGRGELDSAAIGALTALAPTLDVAMAAAQLAAILDVVNGSSTGPLAALDVSGRFHWAAAPASTIVQPSSVHTGVCADPQGALDRLYERLVLRPG